MGVTGIRLMTGAVVGFFLLLPQLGFAGAEHDGLPGLGELDPWVDVHGDLMYGDLEMAAHLRFLSGAYGLQWPAGELRANPFLAFDGTRVCLAGDPAPGCSGILEVQAGAGLLGGGSEGEVEVSVDFAAVQARVHGTCPDQEFLQEIAADGAVRCAPAIDVGYTDEDAVAAVASAGFVHAADLAPVATTGRFQDLQGVSINALHGTECDVAGTAGVLALSFGPKGEIMLACETGASA